MVARCVCVCVYSPVRVGSPGEDGSYVLTPHITHLQLIYLRRALVIPINLRLILLGFEVQLPRVPRT